MAATKESRKIGTKTGIPRKRMLNGKPVLAVKYYGSSCGYGNYLSGMVDGKLILDENGIPQKFYQIGELTQYEK